MSSEISDPSVRDFIARTEAWYPKDTVTMLLADQRRIYDAMAAAFRAPRPGALSVEDTTVPGPAGAVPVRQYRPDAGSHAGVVYFHGGGFVVGSLDSHDDVCAEIALAAGVAVIAVDYRLAPEHPHPAAYEDALAAVDAAAEDRLIVVGDSAGGTLAAAVSVARRERISAQVLIYPGLGGHLFDLPSYAERATAPMLTRRDVIAYGRLRAGGGHPPKDDPSFSPLVETQLEYMPPCFVSVAEHDPLRDDGREWVRRLADASVSADVVVEPELPHGHLRARHHSDRAAEAFKTVCDAIRAFAV